MPRYEKDSMVYIYHRLETAQKAVSKIEGKQWDEGEDDETLLLAFTHLLQTIGKRQGGFLKAFNINIR